MSKSVIVVMAVAALMAGCVSVSAPSAVPTVSATLPITTQAPAAATPSPTASPAPTAAPSATAAASPTTAPTEVASATPEPSGDLGFDQRDALFNDDLSDPGSGWGVGDITGGGGTHVGSVDYADGGLQFAVDNDGGWIWSRRIVSSRNATMRVAGEFIPSSAGRFGLMCASGDTQLYGAVVGTDGSWAFLTIGSDGSEELLSDAAAGLSVPIGAHTAMAVECAGMATGSLRMQLWLAQTGPVAIYESNDGPDNFDRAAAYVEATSAGFSVALENVIAFGSQIADDQLTTAGQQLLTHVPADWQSMCYQSLRPPLFGGPAEAVLACFIGAPGDDGAEIAEYSAYLTADAMSTAYQNRVTAFGTGDGTAASCADGSGERPYNISGAETGRLLCVDQWRGIRFDWTDTRLNILATLIDFDGNYGLTFADWGAGGPNL